MSLRDQLLNDATRFCEERGISLSRLANIVVNDGKFFARVQDGGSFTEKTFEKFERYFATEHDAMNGASGSADAA